MDNIIVRVGQMDITAVVDRIEEGNAILVSEEIGLEISVPLESLKSGCRKGDRLTLTLEE